ncbi:MAG: biopolymer transporter ExbD [Treponematales bacterium]
MNLRRGCRKFPVPLNSLSDVAFLLLIFIMLVSIINDGGVAKAYYSEEKGAHKASATQDIEIWIDETGGIYLNGERIGIERVEEAAEAYRDAPGTRVRLTAAEDTPFEYVHQTLEALQRRECPLVTFAVKDGE